MVIRTILRHEKIGKRFNLVIKEALLKDARNFEIFVDKYESSKKESRVAYNFDFMDGELNDWARRYCMLPDVNLSYLEAISKWGNHNLKKLDPKIILLAQQNYRDGLEKMFAFKKGSRFLSMGVSFEIGLDKDFEIIDSNGHSEFIIKYNKDWLNKEQDGRTILKNFVNFFGFFNRYGQFSIPVSPYSSDGSFLDLIQRTSKLNYANSMLFKYTKKWFDLIFFGIFQLSNKRRYRFRICFWRLL